MCCLRQILEQNNWLKQVDWLNAAFVFVAVANFYKNIYVQYVNPVSMVVLEV